MIHAVLLGDSVFDNAAYVAGGPDVVRQLRQCLPAGAQATLRAVDGSLIRGVERQMQQLPADATHLIVSTGGNDALHQVGIIEERVGTVAAALDRLADIRDAFERDYRLMLDRLLEPGLPAAVCTVYEGRFPDPAYQRRIGTALAVLNDGIIRQAFARGLPLLDLRLICNRAEDYANPIEPSVQGGAKIATAIAHFVARHDPSRRRSEIFVA